MRCLKEHTVHRDTEKRKTIISTEIISWKVIKNEKMPRNYIGKTNKYRWSTENLMNTIDDTREKQSSIRQASREIMVYHRLQFVENSKHLENNEENGCRLDVSSYFYCWLKKKRSKHIFYYGTKCIIM